MKNCLSDLSNNKLADILTFVKGVEQIKILSKLLNGSHNIQTIGEPVPYAAVMIQATAEKMYEINLAEATGETLQIEYRGETFSGHIESTVTWTPIVKGEVYDGELRFLISE